MSKLNQLTNSDFCFSFSIIPFASFSPSNELEGQIKTLLYNKLLYQILKNYSYILRFYSSRRGPFFFYKLFMSLFASVHKSVQTRGFSFLYFASELYCSHEVGPGDDAYHLSIFHNNQATDVFAGH